MVRRVARPVDLPPNRQFGKGSGAAPGGWRRETRSIKGWFSVYGSLLRIAVLFLLAAVLTPVGERPVRASDAPWGSDYLPNVTVYDQNGRALKFYDDVIKGKIAVVSFLYTSCTSLCPIVTARLANVKDALGPAVGKDIVFVSISIDPIPDTPEKLKQMADAYKIGDGWSFLTGDPADIDVIRFKLGERSRALNDHRNEVMLYNDATGEWARDSAFADMGVLAETIRGMDPAWRNRKRTELAAKSDTMVRPSAGHPGEAFFIKICASCHTAGAGDRVGPDLAGVSQRRDKSWLARFLAGPEKLWAARDPIAVELRARFPAVRMPNLGMSEGDIADVLSYLNALDEGKLGGKVSAAGGPASGARPTAR